VRTKRFGRVRSNAITEETGHECTMNGKGVAAVLMVVLLLVFTAVSGSIVDVQADTPVRNVGVAVDDWGLYGDFEVTWNSNDPNAKPMQALIDANRTEWMKISIYNVTPTTLLFRKTIRFMNETEEKTAHFVDIDKGYGDGVLYFISAGLRAGDYIYATPTPGEPLLRINETTSRPYAGITRETNVLNLTRKDVVDSDQVIETTACFYWDKATGILTERWSTVQNKTDGYTTSWTRSDKIAETNLWGTPDTHRPIANAGTNQTVYPNVEVPLDASRSTDNVGIVSYTWTFTDGTTKTLTGVNPTYEFTNSGVYEIALNVTDAAKLWDTDTVTITVIEDTIPPVAQAGPDQTVAKDTPVSFDGSSSSDNAAIARYHWDFGDESDATGPTASHVYKQTGTYTVTLTVEDVGGNTHADITIVTVEAPIEPPYPLIGVLVVSFAFIIGLAFWLRKR